MLNPKTQKLIEVKKNLRLCLVAPPRLIQVHAERRPQTLDLAAALQRLDVLLGQLYLFHGDDGGVNHKDQR